MKKIVKNFYELFFFAAVFYLAIVTNAGAISFIQVNSGVPQTPQSSVSVVYRAAQTAGNLNVVVVGWNDSTAAVTAVTDSKGNVYSRAVGPTVISGVATQAIYYAKNIQAAAANSNSVTVQFSVPAIYADIRILEYSGLDTVNAVDVTAAATGTNATSNSGAVTTTNANDLIFGANLVLTSTGGPGTGFTSRIITNPDGDIAEDRVVTTVGSYSASAPLTSAGAWIMQMVAFKAGAPDLSISKTHTGNFTQGQTGATYTIRVSNNGAVSTSGTVTVTDTVPTGLTPTAISGTGWSCTLGTLTCTRSDALSANAGYPAITLTVNVAGNAPASVTNTATVSGGGDNSPANNTANDVTTINGGIDTAAPDTSITANPPNPSNSTSASFNFTGTDNVTPPAGLTFECELDGSGLTACTSPKTYSSLSVGSHTFRVRALDQAGNVDQSPASFSWTVDTTAPTVTINQAMGQLDPTNASPINFTVIFSEPVTGFSSSGVVIGGTAGGTKSVAVTGSGTTYNLAVSGMTKGTVTAFVSANAAHDGAGNANTASTSTDNSVTYEGIASSGLVAAYSFNEGAGTIVADISGNGNTGTVGNATWTATGRYGAALMFNGGNALVTINDSTALHLTTAMTLEAWVNPSTVGSAWRDVIYKGNDNYYLEGTSASGGVPAGGGTFGGGNANTFAGTTALVNTWTHLAMTYDGATMRLYVNGLQASSLAKTGSILTSTNPLQIGGDSIYGQYFAGMIDEVRIYNVALTQTQIQADMETPIGNPPPDTEPPTAPSNLTAKAVGGSQISLTWVGSTDNFGLASYLVERCQGAGCTDFVQTGSTTGIGTTYFDTDLSGNTTYSYQIRAIDVAGNLSLYSDVASATTQASAIGDDNFNRSDGSLGVNWAKPTASENNMVIVSNQTGVDVEDSHDYAYWAGNGFNDNQYSQITLGNIGSWIGVILRADSTSDRFYMGFVFGATDYRIYARWDGAYYEFARVADGNLTCDPDSICEMPAPGQTWQAGDVLRLEITGDTEPSVIMSRNGVQVLRWTKTVAGPVKTGGNPGIGIYSPSGQHLVLDNWEGGNID